MGEGWNEKAVFLAALALKPEERAAYLQGACPDEAARARIEQLLRHHEDGTERIEPSLPPAPMFPGAAPAAAGDQLDEFRLIERIGEGGMGVVYLAEDRVLGRRVALKILASHLTGSEAAVAKFHDEAKHAAALRHPAIVPVHRFGGQSPRYYLVSDYVDGPTLGTVIAEERRRRETGCSTQDMKAWRRRSAEIAGVIADALDCSHRARIVHCDVKPSNILIDREQGAKLTDFGIAKHLREDSRAKHTGIVGTCHYMSPEQASIAATTIDGRSDVFSLGVVLYEMLALRRPFEGRDPNEVLRAVVSASPAPLRTVDPTAPRDLETICRKAMEKDPERRYQTAAHMAADLRCYLDGRPILARPPGLGRRAAIWAGEHRRLLTAAAAVLALGAMVITGLAIKDQRETIKRQHDATMGWLSVSSESPSRALLQGRDDALRLTPGARLLGAAPLEDLSLTPGQYRLTLVRESDGAFCEFNLVLRAGREKRLAARAMDSNAYRCTNDSLLVGVFRAASSGDEDMVLMPEATYEIESHGPIEDVPRGSTQFTAFLIDRRSVSNREYKAFVDATGYPAPRIWRELPDFEANPEVGDRPVVWLSMADAEAYARWRGKRLPTLFEWQAAARGREGRLYPAGAEAPTISDCGPPYAPKLPDIVKSYLEYTVPANVPSRWDAPDGLLHMFSNTNQLTATATSGGGHVYVAGRSWVRPATMTTLAAAISVDLASYGPTSGFRCARSLNPPKEMQP